MTWSALNFAFFEWLELREHAGSAGAVAAAGESGDGIHGRIGHDDGVELFELVGHGSEGNVLIALNVAVDCVRCLVAERGSWEPRNRDSR